jgi:hypothetical protein
MLILVLSKYSSLSQCPSTLQYELRKENFIVVNETP